MFRSISSVVAAVAIGTMLVPGAAFASSTVKSGDMVSWSSWKTYGNASVDKTDRTVTLSEKQGETEYVYQDVGASKHVNEYVTFVSYTQAEDVRSGGDITGLPYLYAYALDKDGKILSYYQGQSMRNNDDAEDGEWVVSYGTFKVPAKAYTIRYFLKQALESGKTKSGDDAVFYKPAVYFSNTTSYGSSMISSYKSDLDDLNDDNGDTTTSHDGCKDGRSKVTVKVGVDSLVYADDSDADSTNEVWVLWAANKTAWNWSKWGDEHPLTTSNTSSASGSICAKSGDVLSLNGSYMDGTQYLAYKDSSSYGADRVSSVSIDGKTYTIFSDWHDVDSGDRACTFAKNSSGGYDLACTVK